MFEASEDITIVSVVKSQSFTHTYMVLVVVVVEFPEA